MTRDKIYKIFFEKKNTKLYYNELKELTNLSYSSLQNILKKLEENKEIKKEKTKSNVYYQLTNKYKSIEFSKISIDLLNELNIDVKVPIKEFIEKIPNTIFTAILYGSSSIKKEKENSDIDILIIFENFKNLELQKKYEKELKHEITKIKKEIISKYNLSIIYTTKFDFQKEEDFLLKSIKETGFPIINQQKYYQEEKNEYQLLFQKQ